MFENDACEEFQCEPLPCQAADLDDDHREYTYSGSDDTNVDQFFYDKNAAADVVLDMRPSISFSSMLTCQQQEASMSSSLSQSDPSEEASS
jgi:hypothetical protein